MDNDSDSYPAPYGRACSNCSQSKCKCIYSKSGGRCQRCRRLNKECRQPAVHRRQSTRKQPGSKAARLEEKLEDLVSLLRAGVQPPGANPINLLLGQFGQPGDLPASQTALSPPDSLDAALGNAARNVYAVPSSSSDANTPDVGGHTAVMPFSSPSEPTVLQAEEYLTMFQNQLLPYFPCVYIQPGISAQQLRRDRPFTWLCIMAVTCRSAVQRRALYQKIKDITAQQMVHNSLNTDIDILLGLLIYLGWSNQQVYNKANIHVFTQLTTAAVYELGIQNPSARPRMMALCVHHEGEDEPATSQGGQTMEERRAVVACFLVTSIISSFIRKTDPLRWTPFMDECLQVLEEQQECLNDEILVHQVRLQMITDKLDLGPYHGGLASTPDPIQAPPSFYLHSMHARLRKIQPSMPPNSLGYKIVLLHHHYTSLTLHESALSNASIMSKNLNFQQLEYLYGCLEATKSWFNLFLTIPPAEYTGFPFSIFAQMVHNLVVLYQLSVFEDPAWDVNTVRQSANVLSILSTVIESMSQVASLAGLEGESDSDIFSRVAKMYQSVLMGWEEKMGPESLPLSSMQSTQSLPEPLDSMPFNFPMVGDNDWLSDMLNSITQSN
ncbi:hypothetical protein ASPVEDRAFT_87756 [Aspergillus versicolor CBS 583.65]|uniref:Zn(2)-C6 fungal-type domain-containing protein n=1 Tax=Aspergillus versicolor CBS 583.65 TaxID=1036611 RepID=A0A1L9PY60_ASPVE|nr:uncharacterized protein ASPVEDRAFT_87756 [Aspergillus versicolor CBS 583.65]OJJ06457.1 hypothetical protein ASPVEDRAFT_87756 [Aspergillus versicolor CBS 583.65]